MTASRQLHWAVLGVLGTPGATAAIGCTGRSGVVSGADPLLAIRGTFWLERNSWRSGRQELAGFFYHSTGVGGQNHLS